MKKRQTILRQLLLNILVPVLTLFLIVFALTYRYNARRLEENSTNQRNSIVAETQNLIAYFDFAMRAHERTFIDRMRNVSDSLVNDYFNGQADPETADLQLISRKLGLDTSLQHIYLIDRDQIIVNTTFPPDRNLDFAKISPNFGPFFRKVIAEKTFKEDRFGAEMKTGKIKKYSFQPTRDGKYIVELGFYSSEADNYRKLLLEKIQSLSNRYPGIEKVKMYLGTKGIPDLELNKKLTKGFLKCLDTKKSQHIALDNPNTSVNESVDLIFLDVLDAKLYDGYVLEITSNDSPERMLFRDLLIYFGAIFLSACLLLSLIVYSRAKRITRPIEELSARTQAISTENLTEKLSISGSVELQTLSQNFNEMTEKLRISYEGLEYKVRERTAELNEQKELVEHINEEIIDSIHYARFIQQAILPPVNEIQAHFPESFIYYQPKDIIAGDFYWFEQRGTVSWFAAGDCTGHGVPGAMVSVLCINALNQILLEKQCTQTGELLDHVRDYIVKTFTKESQSVKDGMDISLACYDHSTGKLLWTGANNPLWLIRGKMCEIIAPDKQPVGQFDGQKPFLTNELQLQKDDLLILFTDGFADQFGGPKQKKFKYAPLRELLEQHASIDMQELHKLLKSTFNDWKGTTEQTDDVCIFGLRVG